MKAFARSPSSLPLSVGGRVNEGRLEWDDKLDATASSRSGEKEAQRQERREGGREQASERAGE